jgi:hypothetical protein
MANEARQETDGTALDISGVIAGHDDCCCDCSSCDEATSSVTFSGMGEGVFQSGCGDCNKSHCHCDDINGTYSVDRIGECNWFETFVSGDIAIQLLTTGILTVSATYSGSGVCNSRCFLASTSECQTSETDKANTTTDAGGTVTWSVP